MNCYQQTNNIGYSKEAEMLEHQQDIIYMQVFFFLIIGTSNTTFCFQQYFVELVAKAMEKLMLQHTTILFLSVGP